MRLVALAASCAVSLVAAGAAHAGGLQTLEQGTWDMGRAMVGAGVAADSAATAFFNPAAMTLRDKPEFSAGLMGVFGSFEFDQDSSTTTGGGDGGNQTNNTVLPGGVFGVYPVNEELWVGASFTVPFAGVLDPNETWAGRYFLTKLQLTSMRLTPVVAYRVNDWLSLGGGVGINYSTLHLRVNAPLPGPGGDGFIRISDADQWVLNYNFSALVEPLDGTRVSLTYQSEVDNDDMDGRISLAGPGPGFASGLEVGLTLPQFVQLGVRQQLTDDLVLFLEGGWADFSQFDSISLDISDTAAVNLKTKFKDIWGYGLGVEYQLDPLWTLIAGWSYVSSPVSNSNRNAALPFDRQIRYGLGAKYKWREDVTVGFTYEFLDLGSNRINSTSAAAGTLSGKYHPSNVQFVALSFNKTF